METDYLKYTPQDTPKPTLKSNFVEMFQSLVVFAAIGTAIYWLVAQPHKVSGSSMYPNFKDGDYIITDKLSYRFNPPVRGDIVVFKNPRDKSQDFIKRIIGLPNDKVRVENGHVYLNGKQLKEPYLKPEIVTNPQSFIREGDEITVPEGKLLVFGDNRPNSSDSREWGFITNDEIIGKVFLRYWPSSALGLYPAAYTIKNN